MEVTLNEIREALMPFGLTEENLTSEELETLKAELQSAKEGKMILDGVLSNPELYYRKFRQNK